MERNFNKFCDAKTLEEKIALINYWEDDRGADDTEFIADLTKADSDNAMAFVNLYGMQAYERCKKANRYWVCGNAYYANEEDSLSPYRLKKIWAVTEESVEPFLENAIDEAIERFEKYRENLLDASNGTDTAIIDFNGFYGGLIDFYKYAEEKGYTKVTYSWYAISDDGGFEDISKKSFDTKKECYDDMRKAVLSKMTWNTEYEDDFDFEGQYIQYDVKFSQDIITHTSYSGLYVYQIFPSNCGLTISGIYQTMFANLNSGYYK